jgi:hypothetical protein
VAIVSYPEDGATAHDLLAAADSGLEETKRERAAATPDSDPAETVSKPERRAS